MKNKVKKTIRLLSTLLLIVILPIMGNTYAKYIAGESGGGQAEIAKWGFEIVKEGQQTKNIQLINTIDRGSLVNGKIAPGTSGTISIDLDGSKSEVDLEYILEFNNEQNKPNNMFFVYGGQRYSSLAEIGPIEGYIKCNSETKTRNITIRWQWEYETGAKDEEKAANDIIDTQNANTITEYSFDFVETAYQTL